MGIGNAGPPVEVERGLVRLLEKVVSASKEKPQCVVLTTKPTIWIDFGSLRDLKIVDVSGMLPTSSATESQLESSVVGRLLSAGWPPENIKTQHSIGPRFAGTRVVDIALTNNSGEVVAVVEVRASVRMDSRVELQLKEAMNNTGSPFGILTDGTRSILHSKNGVIEELRELPSPERFGIGEKDSSTAKREKVQPSEKREIAIQRCNDVRGLMEYIGSQKPSFAMVDHTLPFGVVGMDTHSLGAFGLSNLETSEPAVIMASLMSGLAFIEQITAVFPRAFCYRNSARLVRELLARTRRLSLIVELPPSTLMLYTAIGLTVISLSSNPVPAGVLLVPLTSQGDLVDVDTWSWSANLISTLQGKSNQVSVEPFDLNKAWTITDYHLSIEKLSERLSVIGEVVKLSEVCRIIPGLKHSRIETPKGTPFLRGRDVSREPQSIAELTKFRGDADENAPARIRAGDILLQRIGSNPSSMVAGPGLQGSIASDTIFILRQRDERMSSTALCEFLRSGPGQEMLASTLRSATVPTLSIASLGSLLIPLASLEISQALEELSKTAELLKVQTEKIGAFRSEIFQADSKDLLSTSIQSMRRTINAIKESVASADTVSFQIRNFYPYFLSFTYRSLASVDSPSERFAGQLRLSENIIVFVACVELAICEPADRKAIGKNLLLWGGISPGHWQRVIMDGARVLEGYESRLAKSLASLLRGKTQTTFARNINDLIELKNDFKHDRGPKTDAEYQEYLPRTQTLLDDCMEKLAFFIEHPIRLVSTVDRVRGSNLVRLEVSRCTGDHPAWPQERIEYTEALTRGDLFIELATQSLASLYPFITVQICPTCKARESYFLDKWDDDRKTALLKSFERGHPIKNSEVGGDILKSLYENRPP